MTVPDDEVDVSESLASLIPKHQIRHQDEYDGDPVPR